jgi:hypothetical protein
MDEDDEGNIDIEDWRKQDYVIAKMLHESKSQDWVIGVALLMLWAAILYSIMHVLGVVG